MTDYGFLANLTLVDKGRTRTPKEKNPEGLTVRVFSDGSVYPSQELVNNYQLEFLPKDQNAGNGIDVIDSSKWTPLQNAPRMLLFGFTHKSEPKIELFGTCRYNTDGTPKSSVLTQGSVCKELLALVKEFGWLTEEQTFVDLKVLTQHPIKTENGVAYIPKVVDRGAKKGEETYVKRESYQMFPVEPTDLAAIQGNVQAIPAANTNELVTEEIIN